MDEKAIVRNNRDTECGFGPCRPSWLKPLAGIRFFIGVYGTLGLLSWSLYTITVSQVSNIEKAFGLSSSETGLMLTIFEIGYAVFLIPASYFSPKAHVPRVIGFVTVLCGIGGIIMALPHFIVYSDDLNDLINATEVGYENRSSLSEYLCSNTSATDVANNTTTELPIMTSKRSQKTLAYALLCIGMILQGIGKAPCYSYSAQYIDDNVDKHKTGFYTGLVLSFSVFGMGVGLGIGSAFSNVYVTLKETNIPPSDTRFLCAWWLGFFVVGVATILIALPMFCFPKRLKLTTCLKEDTIIQQRRRSERSFSIFVKEIKGFGTLEVIRSPVYTWTLVSSWLQVLSMACFLGFEPKYMEKQFAVTAWESNIIVGVSSILSLSLGSVIGGYVTRKFKMTPYSAIRTAICLWFGVILVTTVSMFLGCSHQEINNPYLQSGSVQIQSSCNCNSTSFLPICGDDGLNYYSPCHASCIDGSLQSYSECASIPGGGAKTGLCPTGCNMIWAYASSKFVTNLLIAIGSMLIFIVLLRSSDEKRKGLGLGVSAATTSLTAWLPGPVIGGNVIDGTCLIWNTAATSGKYCAYYNIEWQRYRLHGLMIGLRCVALVLLSVAMLTARKLKGWDIDIPEETRIEIEDESKEPRVSTKTIYTIQPIGSPPSRRGWIQHNV